MFEWNRGFLRAMMDVVLPRAGEPETVARKIVEIMCCEKPKAHYVIGKDARLISTFQWLGLRSFLDYRAVKTIRKCRRLENIRESEKRNRRKKTKDL